jgi:hypothetical protein
MAAVSSEARSWARRSFALGLLTCAIAALLTPWSPKASCGSLPPSYPPILAFELALDSADLAALFGPAGACRDTMIANFRVVNLIDFGYMPAYGGFLACAVRALRAMTQRARAGSSVPPLLVLGGYAALVAPLADVIENICLLTMDLEQPGSWMVVLMIATRAKFLLLALTSLALGYGLFRFESGAMRLFGAAHLPVLPLTVPALLLLNWMPALLPTFFFSWLFALVWVAVRSFRAPPEGAPRG